MVAASFRFDVQKRDKVARQVPRLDTVHLRLSGGKPVTVIAVIRGGLLNVFLSAEAHAGFTIFVCWRGCSVGRKDSDFPTVIAHVQTILPLLDRWLQSTIIIFSLPYVTPNIIGHKLIWI